MNVGQLFVNLGVKGTEKTVGAIKGVRSGLNDTASSGLAAKAAIVGVLYAMERMFESSGAAASDLLHLNTILKMNTDQLQRYQYAARMAGSSNEAITQTFVALADTATKTLVNKQAPDGISSVAEWARMDLTPLLAKAEQGDPEELFKVLSQVLKEHSDGFGRMQVGSFGLSQEIMERIIAGDFDQKSLDKANGHIFSGKSLQAQDASFRQLQNLKTDIGKIFGDLNAQFGGQFFREVDHIVRKVGDLATAFATLSKNAELVKWIGKAFEGWTAIIQGFTAAIDELNNRGKEVKLGKDGKPLPGSYDYGSTENLWREFFRELVGEAPQPTVIDKAHPFQRADSPALSAGKDVVSAIVALDSYDRRSKGLPTVYDAAVPKMAPSIAGAQAPVQEVNVNQTLNFNDSGKDAGKVAGDHKKAIKDAVKQIPATTGGH